jgi:SAM-dependent methyltransferase
MDLAAKIRWAVAAARGVVKEGPASVFRAGTWAVRRALSRAPDAAPSAGPAPRSFPMLCWELEQPDVTREQDADRFEVRGWIASAQPAEGLRFREPEAMRVLPITLEERPLVAAAYGLPVVGFHASCAHADVHGHGPFTLVFSAEGREHEIVVPTQRPSRDRRQLKRAKLSRIEPLLRCPVCSWEAMNFEERYIQCRRCRTQFPRHGAYLDFLTPELRERFRIAATGNVSASVYNGGVLNLINRLHDGLVLDCGAGHRDRYFPNVVNFEIVPYDTTDVVGVGESLPFKDASFDAVLSFAVLEHVKDPFASARELLRVLKPGGTLHVQVPFLQPVHGYPSHYYNMTLEGMRNLFGDGIRVEEAGPFFFGQPIYALSWMLNRYVEGLPPEEREAFRAMRVADLMQPGDRYQGAAFVRQLSPAMREELSCCNEMVATKVR